MVLVIGDGNDRLVREVSSHCRERGQETIVRGEKALFEETPFVLERRGSRSDGWMMFQDRRAPFGELEGVLVRPPRLWWPSAEFDMRDQMFVYHETTASWYAILSSLACPVVNRFGLGWWLQDLGYPIELKAGLARALGLPASDADEAEIPPDGRLRPTARENSDSLASVYIAGRCIIPAPGCGENLASRLFRRASAISIWQEETGIFLCRADFVRGDDLQLDRVDPYPLVDTEPAGVVAEITGAITAAMTTGGEAAA